MQANLNMLIRRRGNSAVSLLTIFIFRNTDRVVKLCRALGYVTGIWHKKCSTIDGYCKQNIEKLF